MTVPEGDRRMGRGGIEESSYTCLYIARSSIQLPSSSLHNLHCAFHPIVLPVFLTFQPWIWISTVPLR